MKAYTLTVKLRKIPIEDHPLFCKPDVRFRHMRTRKAYRKIKEMGITIFLQPEFKTSEL